MKTNTNRIKVKGSTSSLAEAPMTIQTMPKFELDKEFLRKKIRGQEVRTMAHELDLARIRNDLMEKKLVEKQAAFLLVAMRQKILSLPSAYARKIMHIEDIKKAHAILQSMAFAILNEIKDLPNKVIDPGWLEKLEEEESE